MAQSDHGKRGVSPMKTELTERQIEEITALSIYAARRALHKLRGQGLPMPDLPSLVTSIAKYLTRAYLGHPLDDLPFEYPEGDPRRHLH